jgi:ABC-2 type transport system ATP-binding protein
MTAPALQTERLVKTFGTHRALDGLDLQVEPGTAYGFLGPNGAGKTTALRILLGLARPSGGSARVLGHDVTRATNEVRAAVGYLPDVPGFSAWMTAREVLDLCARVFGLPRATARERVDVLLEMAGLADVPTRVGGYSRGMRQRLGLAQALINAPALLLLDEPTSALDPLGRRAVLEMIESLRGRTTVFFSSHILGDVERVCDTVAIVDRGRVLVQSPLAQLRERYAGAGRVLVEVDRPDVLGPALAGQAWVTEVRDAGPGHGAGFVVQTADASAAAIGLPALVARLGVGLRRLEPVEPSLEDVFVALVRGDR